MTEDYLSRGIAAVKAGEKQRARKLLDAAIRAAPDDIRGWGWFFGVCENDTERLKCLTQILRINPNHEQARQRYNELMGINLQTKMVQNQSFQNQFIAATAKRNSLYALSNVVQSASCIFFVVAMLVLVGGACLVMNYVK